jgi:hypothetical protein
MTQYVINIGALPNDGTGDPLRTAFNETNLNFNQIFAAGPVLSNVQIANNTILTTNTNGNLVLAPNGIGVVQSNVSIVPNTSNIRNLGSGTQRWSSLYIQYANISGNLDLAGTFSVADLSVSGNLTVTGNTIQIGNLITDAKTIQLANTASTANAANGSGITVGANDNIAIMLYSASSNTWTMNIGLETPDIAVNNLIVNNISSDDSTFVNIEDGLEVHGDILSETVGASGNITAAYFIGNGSQLTGMYGNSNVAVYLPTYSGNIAGGNIGISGEINAVGEITSFANIVASPGGYFIGDGSQLTGVSNYANANAVAYGQVGWAGNIIPATSNTYSLGNSTNQWNDLYISNATIYMNNVPISLTAGNILTVNGDDVVVTSNTGEANIGNLAIYGTEISIANGATDTLINISPDPEGWAFLQLPTNDTANVTDTRLHNDAGNVEIGAGSLSIGAPTYEWVFDNTGTLIFPRSQASIYGGLDNDFTINTSNTGTATYTFTFSQFGDLSVPINLNVSGNVYTNDIVGPSAGNVAITANTQSWLFDNNGTLTLPGNSQILPAGNTGVRFSAGASDATGLFLNNTGDAEIYANSNVSVYTDAGNTGWTFDTTGNLTAPGNITTTQSIEGLAVTARNINADYGNISLNPDFGLIFTQSNAVITANTESWTFDTSGDLSAPGDISAIGNVTASNLIATGNIVLTGSLVGSGASPAPSLSGFSSISTVGATGNITASGNINGAGATFSGNITAANFVGNIQGTTGDILNVDTTNLTVTNIFAPSPGNTVNIGAGGNNNLLVSNVLVKVQNVPFSVLGNITGNYFVGNGSTLTSIIGANVTGAVSEATLANTVTVSSVLLNQEYVPALLVANTGNLGIKAADGTANITYNPAQNRLTVENIAVGNSITATGNITAANFVGNINITGNVIGTQPNVTLVAGSYSYVFDNTGMLTLPTGSSGNEGGEISFTQAANSTLSGNTVVVDQYVDKLRFFESGGNTRGVYIDLSKAPAGVGGELQFKASGLVNRGVDVTLDNLKARIPATGNVSLQLSTVTGTYSVFGSDTRVENSVSSTTITGQTPVSITTTPTYLDANINFATAGATDTWVIMDTANAISWRISLIVGTDYNNNMITIERLV